MTAILPTGETGRKTQQRVSGYLRCPLVNADITVTRAKSTGRIRHVFLSETLQADRAVSCPALLLMRLRALDQ